MLKTFWLALGFSLGFVLMSSGIVHAQTSATVAKVYLEASKIEQIGVSGQGATAFILINPADVKTVDATFKTRCLDTTLQKYFIIISGTAAVSLALAIFLNKKGFISHSPGGSTTPCQVGTFSTK